MFNRILGKKLKRMSEKYPIVVLVGPRQSGKTTLSKLTFPDYAYVSLEDMDNRDYAESDPRAFLAEYNSGAIIDEAQRAPNLFSYIQTKVDEFDHPGQYILTGSAQFQLVEKVTQSLAGRASLLKLLPLCINEMKQDGAVATDWESQLFSGFYPRIYKNPITPQDWYPNYTQTYIEKDVREMLNVKNLMTFKRFLKLCAGRCGQLLNISELASDCGIAKQTANEWLSILEASFLIYLLPPYYVNFNKRLLKTPKLNFYDSGLVCSLLGIESAAQLKTHPLRGHIFESYVHSELLKHRYNLGREPNLYFWREHHGHEVDCIIELSSKVYAVEVKSGKTIASDYFKGLTYWNKLSGNGAKQSFLIYGGNSNQKRSRATVLGWNNIAAVFDDSK